MSVYKKLHKLQSATRSLAPNTEGQTGQAKYPYVSGAKLLSVIRPMMDELGLLLNQEVVEIDNKPITYMTRNGEKTEMFTSLKLKFTWIDAEDGSTLENSFYANGMNAWDKGLGSALTYAERYYLMKTFHIATDEDDVDALVKEEAIKETAKAPARKATKATKVAPATNFKPLDQESYWKVVDAYVKGHKTKQGGDYRETYQQITNAGKLEMEMFDNDCDNLRASLANDNA